MKQQLPTMAAGILIPTLIYFLCSPVSPSRTDLERSQSEFRLKRHELKLPGTHRQTNRDLFKPMRRLVSWFNATGTGVALGDLDRDGLFNDFCYVDSGTSQVYAGTIPREGQLEMKSTLSQDGLYIHQEVMLPTACLIWDMNQDGLSDILVSYLGRGPALFLNLSDFQFESLEIMEHSGLSMMNQGIQLADLDGDGSEEILLFDSFPSAFDLLDPYAQFTYVDMPVSISHSLSGGVNRVLKKVDKPGHYLGFVYEDKPFTKDIEQAEGWTMAMGVADLSGDLLPEIFYANTFGPNQLFFNKSQPGELSFKAQVSPMKLHRVRSGRIGMDTFKAGGVEIEDFNEDGQMDILVGNLSGYIVPEGNQLFINQATESQWNSGGADFANQARLQGLFGKGWSYGIKAMDLNMDGRNEVIQSHGLIGTRAPVLISFHEQYWALPYFSSMLKFWSEISPQTTGEKPPARMYTRFSQEKPYFEVNPSGFGLPKDCRGVSSGDVDADGDLDLLFACKEEGLVFYRNQSRVNSSIGLKVLVSPGYDEVTSHVGFHAIGDGEVPALNVEVKLVSGGLPQIKQTRYGTGHSGVDSPELIFAIRDKKAKFILRYLKNSKIEKKELELSRGKYTVYLPGVEE